MRSQGPCIKAFQSVPRTAGQKDVTILLVNLEMKCQQVNVG